MYEKNDKRRLYWLIDEYLAGRIDEPSFCDEYYFSFNMEIDHADFLDLEKKQFENISKTASRFSEFEDDHKLDSKAFANAQELREKILEAKKQLANCIN